MSTPNLPPELDNDAHFRQRVIDGFDTKISSEQDKRDQLISIQSFSFLFIQDASRKGPDKAEAVQKGLNVLWYMFLETAKVLDKDDPFQDKLVSLLLWTKELDSLRRRLHFNEPVTGTWESYGFDKYLQTSFEQLLATGTISQQCNLAAFAARAFAIGICRDSIGLTALWCLREVLETDDEAKATPLLLVAVVWLDHCSYSLMTFSALNKFFEDQSHARLLAPGALAQLSGIQEQGFSMKRWLCWRRRLQELSHNADPVVAKEAKTGFMSMVSRGRELDYDIPGEANFKEKLEPAMWEALVRSGKKSLGGDEIDINVDWVD